MSHTYWSPWQESTCTLFEDILRTAVDWPSPPETYSHFEEIGYHLDGSYLHDVGVASISALQSHFELQETMNIEEPLTPDMEHVIPASHTTENVGHASTEPARTFATNFEHVTATRGKDAVKDGAGSNRILCSEAPKSLHEAMDGILPTSSIREVTTDCDSLHNCEDTVEVIQLSHSDSDATGLVSDLKQRISKLLQHSQPRPVDPFLPLPKVIEQPTPWPHDRSSTNLVTQYLLSTPSSNSRWTPPERPFPSFECRTALKQALDGSHATFRLPPRSQSAPPAAYNTPSKSFDSPPLYVTCSPQDKSSAPSSSQPNSSKHGKSLLKRTTGQCNKGEQNNDEGNEDGDGRPIKRRRVNFPESANGKDRLPCIYKVGEPERYAGHVAKYPHISHLLRHLASHGFSPCPKCFKSFGNPGELQMHQNGLDTPCVKTCAVRQCRRWERHEAGSACITTSEQQWKALFKLKYPDLEPPDVFSETPQTQCESPVLERQLDTPAWDDHDSSEQIEEASSIENRVHRAEPRPSEPAVALQGTNGGGLAALQRTNQELADDLRTIRAQVQLLEQRGLAEPSERGRDLEMVLGFVWQLRRRLEPVESHEGRRLRRLISQYAPNVLDPEATHQAEPLPPAEPNDYLLPTLRGDTSEDLFNNPTMAGSVDTQPSDSGYHTVPNSDKS